MKKLLLLTLSLSCFLFAGCGSTSKNVGSKISNEEAQKKIDAAEQKLLEKQYKSVFNSTFNEKTKAEFEYEKKISFNFDMYYETSWTIENDGENCLVNAIVDKSYGKSTGKGTDWFEDSTKNGSFRMLYNATSAQAACDRLNEVYYRANYDEYTYKENGTSVSIRNSKKIPEGISKSTNPSFDYSHINLNAYHRLIVDLIADGFEEEGFVSYENGNTLTIKVVDNYKYGELNSDTRMHVLKESNMLFSQFLYTTGKNRMLPMFYPNNFEFAITIKFNKDGSYSSFNSNYSFDSTYNNYYCMFINSASNASSPRDAKGPYAESKFKYTQTETFTYPTSKITAPSWTKDAE